MIKNRLLLSMQIKSCYTVGRNKNERSAGSGEQAQRIFRYVSTRRPDIQQRNSPFLLAILSLLLVLLSTSQVSYAFRFSGTTSIDAPEIQELLKKVDKATLILININDTIITPKSKMFRYNYNFYRTFIEDLYAISAYHPAAETAIANIWTQRQMMLVEPNWPAFITQLKATGAMVFGFVKISPACKLVKDFEEWQYNQLQQFNINFTSKINGKEIIKFDPTDSKSPSFYKGIIFTNAPTKAYILREFMEITNIEPLKIIIFENTKKELKEIDKFLTTVNVDYFAIEYTAAAQIPGSPKAEVGKFQIKTVTDSGKWLEDEVAEAIVFPNADTTHNKN